MTDLHPTDFLNRADELAPVPNADSTRDAWIRHYAAQAMAAHAAFRLSERTEPAGPHLGYLVSLGVAATAAVVAMETLEDHVAEALWKVTPEAGALNGEWIDFLADTLELHDISPADLYPWFEASDFTPPARLPKVEVA